MFAKIDFFVLFDRSDIKLSENNGVQIFMTLEPPRGVHFQNGRHGAPELGGRGKILLMHELHIAVTNLSKISL